MKRTSSGRLRQGSLRFHMVPILVWIAAVAAVVALFVQRSQQCFVVGLANGGSYNITATSNGRVRSVPVKLFQHVQAGETLVVINTVADDEALRSELEAESAALEMELTRLRAELAAAEEEFRLRVAGYEDAHAEALARMTVDLERARLDALEIRATLEPDRVLLKDYELEVRINRELLSKGAIEAYELQKAQAQFDFMAKTVQENEQRLEVAQKNVDEAAKRLAAWESRKASIASLNTTLDPIRAAMAVQQKRLDQLLQEQLRQREELPLVAPADGVVCQILRRSGDSVLLGEPMMTIAKPVAETLIGWASEEYADQLSEGRKVRIIRRGAGGQVATSEITGVGTGYVQKPMELWFDPKVPEYGLAFEVAIPPGMTVRPNEKVGIKVL